MKTMLRAMATTAAMSVCSLAWTAVPSSANFAIPTSTLNSGVADMVAPGHAVSSSLGDPTYTAAVASPGFGLSPGFWGTFVSVTGCLLDIDGDGAVSALTDGLMILRAMFGLTGTSVTDGAVGPGSTRTTWAQIQPMIRFHALDIDGNGTTNALTDGLMLLRAMSGLTGSAVTNGTVATGASRATWADIRGYLNASCGMNFAP